MGKPTAIREVRINLWEKLPWRYRAIALIREEGILNTSRVTPGVPISYRKISFGHPTIIDEWVDLVNQFMTPEERVRSQDPSTMNDILMSVGKFSMSYTRMLTEKSDYKQESAMWNSKRSMITPVKLLCVTPTVIDIISKKMEMTGENSMSESVKFLQAVVEMGVDHLPNYNRDYKTTSTNTDVPYYFRKRNERA